jgi:hypothetical protein
LFSINNPSVEVSALACVNRGYAVFANHQPNQCSLTVTAREPLAAVYRLTPGGRQPLSLIGRSWELELDGYGGAVVEWER